MKTFFQPLDLQHRIDIYVETNPFLGADRIEILNVYTSMEFVHKIYGWLELSPTTAVSSYKNGFDEMLWDHVDDKILLENARTTRGHIVLKHPGMDISRLTDTVAEILKPLLSSRHGTGIIAGMIEESVRHFISTHVCLQKIGFIDYGSASVPTLCVS